MKNYFKKRVLNRKFLVSSGTILIVFCSLFFVNITQSQIIPSEFTKMYGNTSPNGNTSRDLNLNVYDSQNGEFIHCSTDNVLFKLDKDGNILWQNSLNNLTGGISHLVVLPNREIVLLHPDQVIQGNSHTHFELFSFNQNGTINWTRTYDITGAYFGPMMVNHANDLTIAYAMDLDGDASNHQMGVMKLNSSGSVIWHNTYDFEYSNGTGNYISRSFDNSNNINGSFITSRKYSGSGSLQTILQIDLNGNVILAKEMNTSVLSFNSAIHETDQGNHVLLSLLKPSPSVSNLYVTKFDDNWNPIWNKYLPNYGSLSDEKVTFTEDANDNIYMTTWNNIAIQSNILKISPQGDILKERLLSKALVPKFTNNPEILDGKLIFTCFDDICTGFGSVDFITAVVDTTMSNCIFESPDIPIPFSNASPFILTDITITKQAEPNPTTSAYTLGTSTSNYSTANYPGIDGCNGFTCVDTANFAYTSSCLSDSVKFFDLSSQMQATNFSWDWEFGDGFSSALQNPSHLYATTGQYTVRLIYEYSDGNCTCKDTIDKIIEVLDETTILESFDACEYDKWYGTDQYNSGAIGVRIGNDMITVGTVYNPSESKNNIQIMRLDDNGQIVWDQRINGTGSKVPRGIEVLDNGNLLLAVDTSAENSSLGDFELFTIDANDGTIVGHNRYDFGFGDKRPFLFNQVGENVVDLFFNKGITDTTYNLGYLELDYVGNIIKGTEYILGDEDYYYKVKTFSGAGYVAVGTNITDTLNNGLIVTLDKSANLQRAVQLSDNDSLDSELLDVVTYDLACSDDENDLGFAVVGQKEFFSQGYTNLMVIKFDEDINMIWNTHLFQLQSSSTNGGLRSLTTDSEKNLYLSYLKPMGGSNYSKRIFKTDNSGNSIWTKEFIPNYNFDNLERTENTDTYRYFGKVFGSGFGSADFVFGVVDTSFTSCLLQPAIQPTIGSRNKTFYQFLELPYYSQPIFTSTYKESLSQTASNYLDMTVCLDCIDPCVDTCSTCLIPTEGETYTFTVDVKDIYFPTVSNGVDTDTAYVMVKFLQTDSTAGPFYPLNYGTSYNTITGQFIYPVGIGAGALEILYYFKPYGVRFDELRITPQSGSPVYIYDRTIHRFIEE